MRIVAPIFLFPLASKKGLMGFVCQNSSHFSFTFFQSTNATVPPDASCNDVHFIFYIFFRVPMLRCSPMPFVMMYIFVCTFFQGTDATVLPNASCNDVYFCLYTFSVVTMPRYSPWTTKIAWEGDRHTDTQTDIATTRLNPPSGPIRWKNHHTCLK